MRAVCWLLVVTISGISLACGSSTPTGPTSPSVRTFRLTGTVTDREAGSPLSGATVAILDGPNVGHSATTAQNGTFTLADLRESGFTVKVTRDAYDEFTEGITLTADTSRTFSLTRTKLDVSGEWSGTLAFTLDGTSYTRSTTAQMTLADLRLTVTAPSANGYRSTLDGRLSAPYPGASFAGSLALDALSDQEGVRCLGTSTAVTGSVTSTAITFSAATVTFAKCLGDMRNVVFTLSRTRSPALVVNTPQESRRAPTEHPWPAILP